MGAFKIRALSIHVPLTDLHGLEVRKKELELLISGVPRAVSIAKNN